MGERWIVFLVLASLGGGIYIMSYFVDEESYERYGKNVAEYNAQHHETMMDAALHRAKRGAKVDVSVLPSDARSAPENDIIMEEGLEGVQGHGRAMQSDDLEALGEPNIEARDPDDPYIEVTRAIISSKKDVGREDPKQQYLEVFKNMRYSGQGMNREDSNQRYLEVVRARSYSSPGMNGQDPNDRYHEVVNAGRSGELSRRKSSDYNVNQNGPDVSSKISAINNANEQGTITELQDNDHSLRAVKADLYVSSEDDDAQERFPEMRNLLIANSDPGMPSSVFVDFDSKSSEESIEEFEVFVPEEIHNIPHINHLSRHLLSLDGDKKLITFNKGIDFILKLMNAMFALEGEDSVPLPTLNKTFGHGIMQGTFEASNGFFKNPATLHRTGDVAIVKNGDSVGLEVALGLETLAAGYNNYDLRTLKIHQNGTLDVSVAENSIKMKISLIYYPQCKVDVNYLELDKLGGIKVDITGLGAFQSMFDMLSKWLLDNFTNDFRVIVNKKLIEKAKKAVARQDICKYFPLNLL